MFLTNLGSATGLRKFIDLAPGSNLGEVTSLLEESGASLRSLRVVGLSHNERQMVALVHLPEGTVEGALEGRVAQIEGVTGVEFSG